MRFYFQPFESPTLGAKLTERLDGLTGTGSAVRMAVAYARATGVLRMAPTLQRYRERGGYVEAIVGIGRDSVTSRQALQILLDYTDALYVFNNASTTFHPKVYLLREGRERAVAYIGSNNLTTGGLYTNYEAFVETDLDLMQAAHRRSYRDLSSVIQRSKKARRFSRIVINNPDIDQLSDQGLLRDETRPLRDSQGVAAHADNGEGGYFDRNPPPQPPPIDPALQDRIPRVRPEELIPPAEEPVQEGGEEPDGLLIGADAPGFVMQLDNRDARQKKGYSPEIYIPLDALNRNPNFWGWEADFTLSEAGHPERRVDVLVRPVGADAKPVNNKRLWYYAARSEFRFNNRELIAGSSPGDLAIIFKAPVGSPYQYAATIITPIHPAYQGYYAACVNEASPLKRWGYF